MFVRLVRFRPVDAGVIADRFLRESVEPGLLGLDGLRYLYSGRGVQSDLEERIVVSLWADGQTLDERDARALAGVLDFEHRSDAARPSVEFAPVTFAADFDMPDPPQILRVFRGRIAEGEVEAYVEAARAGTYADHEAQRGPLALFLAAHEHEVVTVSAWSDWSNVERATGGDIRNPIATRHSERLPEFTVAHYEIVPRSIAGRVVGRDQLPIGRAATSGAD